MRETTSLNDGPTPVISKWYKPANLDELVALAVPGDLIEMGRGLYSHWAVYAGERMFDDRLTPCVFHCGSDPRLSCTNVFCCCMSLHKRVHGIGAVAMEPLKDVCRSSSARINNKRDKKWPPLMAFEIVQRAEFKILDQEEYDFLTNNCEHFAKWCRYGVKESYQVKRNCVGCLTCVSVSVPIAITAIALAKNKVPENSSHYADQQTAWA